MVVVQHCEYTKCYLIFHFKMVNFTSCQFHLNKLFLILIKLIKFWY